ncbi:MULTISPECIES: hypothetical protein [unclassified Sulfitobacter]|nr:MULTISPECIES: hypothetical protein [unclassified Sulfitobacter]
MFVALTVILSCLIITDIALRSYDARRSARVQARIKRSINRSNDT